MSRQPAEDLGRRVLGKRKITGKKKRKEGDKCNLVLFPTLSKHGWSFSTARG